MSSLRIAVVVPYYQREPGILVRALRSVEAQEGVDDVAVIVVDDASPIPASEELARWEGQRRFPIEVIQQPNGGPASARNRGLDALGDNDRYIAFLDSDDEWMPRHLAHALEALSAGHDFYFSDFYQPEQTVSAFRRAGRIDPARHPMICGSDFLHRYEGDMFDQILTGNVIGTSAVVIDRRTLGDIRFKEDLVQAGEDYVFWMTCARRDARFCFSAEVEAHYGAGVNVYSGAGWGTENHLKRVHHEMKYRKLVLNDPSLSAQQRRFVEAKITDLRHEFAAGLINRVTHRRPIDWAGLKAQALLDPRTMVDLPVVAGSEAAARIKRKSN